jgi:SagB-type dehydrogenase family enzyme
MARPVDIVNAYHQRTKHHLHRYARSTGQLDWANQPNPFRHYEGTDSIALYLPEMDECPLYDELFGTDPLPAAPVNQKTISQLLYFSLAISAWKQIRGSTPWSLRVNPSSGDLHPTETYLISGPDAKIGTQPAVYHYNVHAHALETRTVIPLGTWETISKHLPPAAILLGFTSIHWRESWKYGERAFRYCHHDLGHAIAAVCYSAAIMGWSTRLINAIRDSSLAALLGVFDQHGVETEHPDTLLVLWPNDASVLHDPVEPCVDKDIAEVFRKLPWQGRPNRLSGETLKWDAIDEVSNVVQRESPPRLSAAYSTNGQPALRPMPRPQSARAVIQQRRSAVAMDGRTTLKSSLFYDMISRTMPRNAVPFGCLPWPPTVSLAIFVHRVTGLEPGLYMLIRDPAHLEPLRKSLSDDFDWAPPTGCPEDVPLLRLAIGDGRAAARTVSCHQDIAADGVFSLGMLARFDHAFATYGAAFYTRIYWETGVIGQALYLEAEAADLQSTGIGCYFDDAMHDILGITDTSWQSLYHFTVGGPLDDPRLQTLPPYGHLTTQQNEANSNYP